MIDKRYRIGATGLSESELKEVQPYVTNDLRKALEMCTAFEMTLEHGTAVIVDLVTMTVIYPHDNQKPVFIKCPNTPIEL